MSNPNDPTQTPGTYDLAGIHEYDVTIPFQRGVAEERQDMHIVVRIPAADEGAAFALGARVAEHVGKNHEHDGNPWIEVITEITAVNVDNVPAPAVLAAELAHWRRVVAALAGKFPGLLQLTENDYNQADPSSIVASRMDDTMVFLSPAAFGPPPDELFTTTAPAPAPADPTSGMQTPGNDPRIAPITQHDAAQLPANPDGHTDPDVRRVSAATLARAESGQVEVLVGDVWRSLDTAVIDHEQGTVRILAGGDGMEPVPGDHTIVSRPATTEGYASDLPRAATLGQQMLTAHGWMEVESAEDQGAFSGHAHKVMLVGETGGYQTSLNAADPLLLRNTRPEWWS